MRAEIPRGAVGVSVAAARGGEPSPGGDAGTWRKAAERFYDAEAEAKADPRRHRLFALSYRRVGVRLGLPAGARVLDAGCGCGELTAALGDKSLIIGADLSARSLRQAKGFHPRAGFLGADISRLPFPAECFDGVAALTSVEFCPDRLAALKEFARVLKPGARLYLDARNEDFLLFRLMRPWMPLLIKAGLVEPYPADGFRDWSVREWEAALARAGFRIRALHPSVWPWNFGGLLTRAKNLLIEIVKRIAPVRSHYMTGFLAEKIS